MFAGAPRLAAMFPPAQANEARSTISSPTTVVVPSVCAKIVTMPEVANNNANH